MYDVVKNRETIEIHEQKETIDKRLEPIQRNSSMLTFTLLSIKYE